MSSEHQPSGLEPAEVVVEEVVTIAAEPEPTIAVLSVPPHPASATTRPSRLSTAFKRISNGCGLCIHPFRNSGPTDYHALVHTPTDETPGLYQESYDVVPVSVPEPKLGNGKDEVDIAGSSATAGEHYNEIHYHREAKVDQSQDIQQREQQDQFTFVEEITVMSSANDDIIEVDNKAQEVQAHAEIEETTDIERGLIEKRSLESTTVTSQTSTTFEETSVLPVSPVSPIPIRANGAFAKFTKRSTSSSAVSASGATSSPSSSTPSSPLLERLGRFTKIIRPSETSISVQSKVESLKNSTPLTVEVPVVAKAEVESVESLKVSAQKDIHVDQGAVLDEVVEIKEETTTSIEETTTTTWTNATPPPPQPQQQTSDRRDLSVDTAVLAASPKAQPVAIPSQSKLIHPWTNSPATQHKNDASSGSNPSLSRAGRSSTIDSTLEGSEGSVDSGKEASKATKRRKSVLKKLGKIINNMNTNRKNSVDSKSGRERRMSRHGSQTMESPIEADENFLNK